MKSTALALLLILASCALFAADHNAPNSVNSIFSDVAVSAADLYDIFGFPSADQDGGEKVVIALTFASVPKAGVLDNDMLYRVMIASDRRVIRAAREDHSLQGLVKYFEGLKDKYFSTLKPGEVRVRRWAEIPELLRLG